MKLYIQISFWIGVLAFVVRIIEMAAVTWPKKREPMTLGMHVATTILGIGFTIWCGILLFL